MLRHILRACVTFFLIPFLAPGAAQAQTLQEKLTKSITDNLIIYLRIQGPGATSLSKTLGERFSTPGQEFVLNCWNDETCVLGFHRQELRTGSQLDPKRSVSFSFPVSDGTKTMDVLLTLRTVRRGETLLSLQLSREPGTLLWQKNFAACRFVETISGGNCEFFEAGIGPRYHEVPLTDAMYGKLGIFTARLQGRSASVLFQKLADRSKDDTRVARAAALYPDGKSTQLYQVRNDFACIQIKSAVERTHVCNLRINPAKGLKRQEIVRWPGWTLAFDPRFQASQLRSVVIELEEAGRKQTMFSGLCPVKNTDSLSGECEGWVDDPYPIDEPFPPFFPPVQGVAVGWRSLLRAE